MTQDNEQEMLARVVDMESTLVASEAMVPEALEEAVKPGRFGSQEVDDDSAKGTAGRGTTVSAGNKTTARPFFSKQ